MRFQDYFPLVLVVCQTSGVRAQGTFRNLDFELSQIPQTQPSGLVSASLALPSWTVYYGPTQQTQVLWEALTAGSTAVTLVGTRGIVTSIDGGYSAELFGGGPDASISQVGVVPSNARSVIFKAQVGGLGQVSISVAGVTLPLVALLNGPNYTLYGADVSQYAGLQEQLAFTAAGYHPGPTVGPSYWNIDDIVFSTTEVPEPSESALIAVGGLLFIFLCPRPSRLPRNGVTGW